MVRLCVQLRSEILIEISRHKDTRSQNRFKLLISIKLFIEEHRHAPDHLQMIHRQTNDLYEMCHQDHLMFLQSMINCHSNNINHILNC